MNDMPLVEMTDNRTGRSYDGDDILDAMSDADLQAIATEMKRRVNLLTLPGSMFYKGSEFRQFVEDFTAQHGETPKFFSIGDQEMPIPERWGDDPLWSMVAPELWDNGPYRLPREVKKDEDGEEIRTCAVCGKVM